MANLLTEQPIGKYILLVSQMDHIKEVLQLLRVSLLVIFAVIVGLTGGLINRNDTKGLDFYTVFGMLIDALFIISVPIVIYFHNKYARKLEDL